MPTTLSLIVLRSANVAACLTFYGALDIAFVQEQHDSGPLHHAAQMGGVVLEIYPAPTAALLDPNSGGATMLGVRVASLDETLTRLRKLKVEPKTAPKEASWGHWANVADPDGRVVQLVQS